MDMQSLYYPVTISLHALAAVVWVGGMFFAYMALRPVAAQLLEPPLRLELWSRTLSKFFTWIWLAIIALPATGYWIIFSVYNGFAGVGWSIHLMHTLGIVMILIFLHVFFAPFRRLRQAVNEQNYQEGARNLGIIRTMVGVNLIIGLVTIVIAVGLHRLGV